MLYDIATVFWRDWVVLKRRLGKFILSRMVAPMLYLTALGWGLGRSIDIGGGSYIDFLAPGILALNSMNISFNSVTPVHAERVYHKSMEEYILAPIKPASFVLGKVLAAVLRSLISGFVILALSFAFGAKIDVSLSLIMVLGLNAVVFAELGFFVAMKVNTFEEMSQVSTYFLLPMSFLCGTFFRIDTLPEYIRAFIEILPLTHTSSLLRSLAGGGEPEWMSLLILLCYGAILFELSIKGFNDAKEG